MKLARPQFKQNKMETKFKPTHNMTFIGRENVPVVIVGKHNHMYIVATEAGQQFWVGKYYVEEIK